MDVDLENPFTPGAGPGALDDPFAAAGLGALAPSAAPAVSSADPFAAPPPPEPADPFASAPLDDPFAAPPPQPGVRQGALAVTDLADLLGAAAAAAPPPEPEPSPEPEPEPEPEPSPEPEPPAPEAEPDAMALPAIERSEPSLGGLSLEDPTLPPLAAGHAAPEGAPGLPEGVGFALADPQAFGAFDLAAADAGPALALGDGPSLLGEEPAPPPPPAAALAPPPLPTPPAAPAEPEPEPEADAGAAEPAAPGPASEHLARRRDARLRTAFLNGLALAAMLVVAVGLLVVWRSDGPFDASSLRPSRVVAALRGAPAGPFAAIEVGSGVYERERGAPLLLVRGKVLSRAPAAVKGVKVVVEVVRDGAVVARGEALAGAVPTAEELWSAPEGASAASLAEAAAARAPGEIRPGDAVPFLVALADAPADLEGASVRVVLAATGAPP